jgi:hypothetical protein
MSGITDLFDSMKNDIAAEVAKLREKIPALQQIIADKDAQIKALEADVEQVKTAGISLDSLRQIGADIDALLSKPADAPAPAAAAPVLYQPLTADPVDETLFTKALETTTDGQALYVLNDPSNAVDGDKFTIYTA